MVVSPAVSTLCENSNEVFLNVAKLLLTYADNILRYPNEEKYRSIRIGNPTFSTKLLPIKGAVECLFEMGFEEAETHLVFPSSASVEQLKIVKEAISTERNQRLSGQQPLQSPQTASSSSSALQLPPVANPTNTQSPSQESSLESSMGFFVTLQSNFQHVMVYEDPALQQKAKSHIPLEQLSSAASEKLKQAAEEDPDCTLGLEDFLVHELLSWFKKDFFSWVNCLPCEVCGGETQTSRALNPTADDKRWGARHVESHYCTACQVPTRFPRYNSPEKLLETRRGRCGEWANCFTLCCRAVGLEARYIWDSTDHVWTEIYSVSQRRWIHCDPCENVCDKPLLYEVGWGKKLAYVMAFSKDQVVDVTWRYSCKHPEVLKRRNTVQETWLRCTITGFSTVRQQSMSPARKKELTDRLLVELVEFLSPKTSKQGDLGGRNSGSLAWRIARGETGDAPSGTSNAVDECVFQPTEKERNERLIHLRYSATSDQYCRVSNSSEVLVGWQQGVWKAESVFRKVETDWQMVYIARTEGSSTGRVAWKFDFARAGMKMKALSIRATSQTFHSGQVLWRLRADQMTTEFAGDGKMQSFPGLSGSSQLVVEVELTGGDGESSWQHSQLFRQSLRETEESSFEIQIELEDA